MEPKAAYEILKSNAKPEGDAKRALLDIIKKDPEYASEYAYWAYHYARTVIKGRWHEAEEIIKTDPKSACFYAKNVIQGRFPEAEPFIKTHPSWACYYANEIIRDTNFWRNQELLADLMKPKSKPKSEPKTNSELDDLKKQREELDNRIKQLECA